MDRRDDRAGDGRRPAAGRLARDGQRRRNHEDGDGKGLQPVHPMRRIPPYADCERYVSDMMFVPHASHFASIT